MKNHVAIRNLKYFYNKVFRCGYCDLQYIFKGYDPQYYNCGVYGWNCDVYAIEDKSIAITTGYRNMTGERIPHDLLEKYTKKAKKIIEKHGYFSDKCSLALKKNREKFIEELASI